VRLVGNMSTWVCGGYCKKFDIKPFFVQTKQQNFDTVNLLYVIIILQILTC